MSEMVLLNDSLSNMKSHVYHFSKLMDALSLVGECSILAVSYIYHVCPSQMDEYQQMFI